MIDPVAQATGEFALFAYGTLCVCEIMQQVVGRRPASVDGVLSDHAALLVRGEVYPGAIRSPGADLRGRLYTDLKMEEMALLDDYEGSLYELCPVLVDVPGQVRTRAVCYLVRPEHVGRLSTVGWDLEVFIRDDRELDHFKKNGGFSSAR
jgi:gamma-glutamylcyclotransferase (GGCT)/AIG2-like uncharacterized protein YtfP